jgi:phage shock protein PspC (stress-responsive transcriptional regulator)
MEKIININMAGRVIAIEDKAYTSLKAYLESLHSYFAQEEGGDEIINDIESRVAELMADKIRWGRIAINEADIEEIIGSMGRVEDFAASEEEAQDIPHTAPPPRRKRSKRFFRDSNDRLAGGVCSGLANYMNVDPALIRIVFAILTLGGWGAGLLLYIALWIFVPSAPLESFRGRRLFRDADDKWIGGVCSGMAAYFDKEPWIFRLIFALPFLLSIFSGSLGFFIGAPIFFGSFTGTFVLIYIVLWIVLPLATTDFQKMEMRGEKVDLNSIRENVMADIKDRAKSFGNEVSESASRLSGEANRFVHTRGRAFAQEAAAAARPIASTGSQVIAALLKAFLIFVGSIIAFALFITLIGYSFGGFSGLVNDYIMRTPAQRTLGWVTVFLFFGVPLLALITLIVRRTLRIRGGGRYFALGYSLLWVGGIVCLICLTASVSKEFRRGETIAEEIPIAQPAGNRLIITVPDQPVEYSNSLPWVDGDIRGWDVSANEMRSALVLVLPTLSPDSMYHVVLKRYSRGASVADASSRAGQISYALRNSSDSVLQLASGYRITKSAGYRGQNVIVEVQVPAGKKIRFDASVEDKLVAFSTTFRERFRHRGKRWEARWDDEDIFEQEWEPGIDYVMGINGELTDPLQHTTARYTERSQDSLDRAMDRRMDSLDRAMDAIGREKDMLDRQRED